MDRGSLPGGATWLVVAIAVLASACSAAWTPFQASLYNPAQLYPESTEVRGLRLNLLYGENARVAGVDLGCVNLAGEVDGVQIGGLVNGTKGRVRGVQVPAGMNHAGSIQGLHIGVGRNELHVREPRANHRVHSVAPGPTDPNHLDPDRHRCLLVQ